MAQRLSGKNAVITGAASGIGAATARLFASEGAKVALLDIDIDAARQLATELNSNAYECDVAVAVQVQAAIDDFTNEHGPIHVLFNNAGIALRAPVGEQAEADWDRVIDTNVKGAYLCSKAAMPHFPPEGASIIHTASVVGIMGVRGRAAYSAAKAALVGLARNMALDYAHRNIRVNCVCPGYIKTPFIAAILADEQRAQRLTAMHPLGRLGDPQDIARAVLFLASEESSWITGHALVVDGGFSVGQVSEI